MERGTQGETLCKEEGRREGGRKEGMAGGWFQGWLRLVMVDGGGGGGSRGLVFQRRAGAVSSEKIPGTW